MAKFWQKWILAIAALFAFSLSVYRATTQAITLDEAMTYRWYVSGLELNNLWTPFPNNHLLNSLLIWVSTHTFGTSELTVRIPALIGAALYIFTCFFLCRRVTDRFSLQIPLFICLVYNPFILDYMAAARGYGLANAFLLAAIAIPVWHHLGGPSLRTSCALASLALALSFTANFSFALVNLVVFVSILIWALRSRGKDSAIRILGICTLPGFFVVLILAGYTLTHWPPNQLVIGAQSLTEMRNSLVAVSLYQLNPRFVASRWYKPVMAFQPYLLPILGILCIVQLAAALRATSRLAVALMTIVSATLVIHWLAFRVFDLPLPKTRAGIFFLPLFTLAAGAIAASQASSIVSRVLRVATTTAFACLAVYFLLCLRTAYFVEYIWDAEMKEAYSALSEINHTKGVTTVEMNLLYHASLDFYRRLSKSEHFSEFTVMGEEPAPGKKAYVLLVPHHQSFIDREGLLVIFRGRTTEVAVAIRE